MTARTISPSQLEQVQDRTRALHNQAIAKLEAELADLQGRADAAWIDHQDGDSRDQYLDQAADIQRQLDRAWAEWAVFDAESDELLSGPYCERDDAETAERDLIAHGRHRRSIVIGQLQ